MTWRWWRQPEHQNGETAKREAEEAERRLRETRRQWPEVKRAHDALASLIESALRGQR